MFIINNVKWKLNFVPLYSEDLMRSDGTYTFGMCDGNTNTISIANGLDAEFTERILCHELTHAVCFSYEIFMPIDLEEKLCNFMSEHGREIIDLLDYLLSILNQDLIRNIG
jgi:hypothetical protein